MQNFWIVPVANGDLEKEDHYGKQNQYENCRRISELAARSFMVDGDRTDCGSIVRLRFEPAK